MQTQTRKAQKMTRVPAVASTQGLPPILEQPCLETTSSETLLVAAATAVHAQSIRKCIPGDSWVPRRSLLQTPLDCAVLRASAAAPWRRALKSGTRDPRSPSARQSALPPPRASPCLLDSTTADAVRSGRCCVQDSEMRSWPFRRRPKAAGNSMLFADRARTTLIG